MNFLFIHGNYPAQFRNLIVLLGQNKNHKVVYMTERTEAKHQQIAGVRIVYYEIHRRPSSQTHHYLEFAENAILHGQATIRSIDSLMNEGFIPEIVITHAGNGLGLYIKDILKKALHISYFEWYFRSETSKYLLSDFSLDTELQAKSRNIPILQELECCDIGVVPTSWQKSQFPSEYSKKLKIIFDGIDISFFKTIQTNKMKRDYHIKLANRESHETFEIGSTQKVLSYATRGMETLRGFPEFMNALPATLNHVQDLIVIIAGLDRRAYSYNAPTDSGSWKDYMLEKLGDFEGKNRIIFTGLLNYEDYRKLLWRSDLHCYFTRPYITSWSLFEAGACGSNILVNRCKATDFIVKNESANWTDLDDQNKINQSIIKGLTNPPKVAKLLDGYTLEESIKEWGNLISGNLTKKS